MVGYSAMLDSCEAFLGGQSWVTGVSQGVLGAAVPLRSQAHLLGTGERAEPAEPRGEAESARVHCLSCCSLQLQDMNGGLEEQNKFFIHIYKLYTYIHQQSLSAAWHSCSVTDLTLT